MTTSLLIPIPPAPPSQSQHIDTNASPGKLYFYFSSWPFSGPKPLAAIFPGTLSECEEEEDTMNPITLIVTIEEAMIEGCSRDEEMLLTDTPIKCSHSRPMSEQLLGCS